jgi:outer membrane receptor protein involved in Fe transport
MKLKTLLLTLVLFCTAASLVLGATTGKITGVVTDAQTGEPLVGVTVMVVGTNLGASTDPDGKYTINNLPVGTYTVRMSSVGYATLEVSDVRVSVDLATYQDGALSSQATDIGKTIQVIAERKLVMKDKTTTVEVVSRDELLALPTRGFEQVVGIQNSVVRMNSNIDVRQRGGREPKANAPEINMRGGRPSEVAYYVDGFSQQDPLSGISTTNINNNAIKEISITSGAFDAEYGHVASGIVNVTTNSGTDKYRGNLDLLSDNVASAFGYDSFDQNWYSADLGGPIPGIKKGYFFFSGERRYMGDRDPSIMTKDIYTRFGVASRFEDPQEKPNNSLQGWSYQGKLDFDITSSLKLQLSGNGSLDRWQRYVHYFFNPSYPEQIEHSPRYKDQNLGLNAKITHTLSANMFYNLSASYFDTRRRQGDGVVFEDYLTYDRGFANPEWDQFTLLRQGTPVYASEVDTTIEPGASDDVLVSYTPSYWTNYYDRRSSYIGFKGDITNQVTSGNTLKLGFDFQRHTVKYFENLNATQGDATSRVNRYGFDANGEVATIPDSLQWRNGTKNPINLGLYLQDRFEYRGLIVRAGLRFDFFDYKALRLRSLTRPFDPDNTGNAVLTRSDLENSQKFTRLSPRLGISFPISDRTQMHINYGLFFQRPDLRRLYLGYDFMQARILGGSYYPFPSPNLKPETITQYEVGVSQQLGEVTAFDITAYYKDVKDLTQIYHQNAVPKAYDFFSNIDFGTIKGVDFSLTMRRTHNISMTLKYSLCYASGTGSFAQSTYNIAWKDPAGTPKTTNPLDYDQRHSIIGMFDLRTSKGEGPKLGDYYIFENLGLNTVIQMASGLPYTPMRIYDAVSAGVSVQQIPTGPINSARGPWTWTIDMKLERTLTIAGYEVVPYVWVKNLLNRENVVAVYEGTGKPETSGYLATAEGQSKVASTLVNEHTGEVAGQVYAYRYDLAQNNPNNWSNPRMILAGLRMSF